MQRLIIPWEYRHLRAFGVTRIAGGLLAGAAGVVCLAYAAYGWAAFFLVVGALNLALGCWYITIARRPVKAAAEDTSRHERRGRSTRRRRPPWARRP